MKITPSIFVLTVIVSILLISSSILANDEDDNLALFLKRATEIGQKLNEKENTLMALILKTEDLFEKYTDDPLAKDIVSQSASTLYSFTTDHLHTLEAADKGYPPAEKPRKIQNLNEYEAVSAINAIVSRAKNERIIMINEAHHIAQHRVLTLELLPLLWQQGYRYLALETLSTESENHNSLEFIERDSGYYTKEPIFAFMVSHAKRLGFKLVSYDSAGGSTENRETKASENIKRKIFDQDPNAKVIFHVGYSHIDETEWLASKLKSLLNIDPLTIDQTKLSEKSKPEFESKDYRAISAHFSHKEPIILMDKRGDFLSTEPEKWDISIISPRSQYINGKPTWALRGRKIKPIATSVCKDNYPCMVEVYPYSESFKENISNLVPFDRSIVHNADDENIAVLVDKGKYIQMVTDLNGNVISKAVLSN